MRRATSLAGFFAVFANLAFALPVSAQNVTGTWELTWEGFRGSQTTTFVLTQDGTNVTGTAQMQRGENTMEVPIKDGTIHGDQFTFTLEMGMGQRTMTQTFAATVKDDTMEGKITTPRGESPFTGARKKS